ncbi:thiosulfate/3-mercaptopyruvate sulfurtransferase [Amphibacillus marinus]|uniref:Thiosulfate/3-mercaptopyruvate sulfurtransferase n=1 Tax=Amphibacillus marinus TaxID=872970 RepID=A0A1H8K272_9BACI|nr:sulfurtransferase [Amphibacillus marinus]SEN87119.1 thiosulfate/3-mercaptopyruvate sulfurtransferase [Amphibacillus marinus]
MEFLINAQELYEKISDVIIIDTRFELLNPSKGEQLYKEGHIPGAQYFSLHNDLSAQPKKHGGSHPLPDQDVFLGKLSEAGITKQTTVVIYDQGNAMFAARLYWLLEHYGHRSKYILNGGIAAWINAKLPITSVVKRPLRQNYQEQPDLSMIVNVDDVKASKEVMNTILIDARSRERYLGKSEPLYRKAGHIPGAKCFDWTAVLTAEGKWRSKEELAQIFGELDPNKEIILSCGSGVSACMNYLALTALGYKNVKLYPGSFSDWISYPELPIETKAE